jgi:hypothetical protein
MAGTQVNGDAVLRTALPGRDEFERGKDYSVFERSGYRFA